MNNIRINKENLNKSINYYEYSVSKNYKLNYDYEKIYLNKFYNITYVNSFKLKFMKNILNPISKSLDKINSRNSKIKRLKLIIEPKRLYNSIHFKNKFKKSSANNSLINKNIKKMATINCKLMNKIVKKVKNKLQKNKTKIKIESKKSFLIKNLNIKNNQKGTINNNSLYLKNSTKMNFLKLKKNRFSVKKKKQKLKKGKDSIFIYYNSIKNLKKKLKL